MPLFADGISKYLISKSIEVEIWTSGRKGGFFLSLSKWVQYFDQFIVFPLVVRFKLLTERPGVLYVFSDQALGPWVPMVSKLPHVIHCHDLMALKSALGKISENPTSFTGRVYQKFIRRGFQKGKHFISISNQTQEDLIRFGGIDKERSDVVYNGLNFPYRQQDRNAAFQMIFLAGILSEDTGCLLHVGGGQWYKNTHGIIKIYSEYCHKVDTPKPLV
jgi:hypothetical protein